MFRLLARHSPSLLAFAFLMPLITWEFPLEALLIAAGGENTRSRASKLGGLSFSM
jgi:hypothetical protein